MTKARDHCVQAVGAYTRPLKQALVVPLSHSREVLGLRDQVVYSATSGAEGADRPRCRRLTTPAVSRRWRCPLPNHPHTPVSGKTSGSSPNPTKRSCARPRCSIAGHFLQRDVSSVRGEAHTSSPLQCAYAAWLTFALSCGHRVAVDVNLVEGLDISRKCRYRRCILALPYFVCRTFLQQLSRFP